MQRAEDPQSGILRSTITECIRLRNYARLSVFVIAGFIVDFFGKVAFG